MNNNNNNLLSYMKWELKLVPFFLYSANFPQNCPSNDAFNSESPITELVMMASPRCRDGFDRRYYIETLRDHRNNCEFDIIATIKHFHNTTLFGNAMVVFCEFLLWYVHNTILAIISIMYTLSFFP